MKGESGHERDLASAFWIEKWGGAKIAREVVAWIAQCQPGVEHLVEMPVVAAREVAMDVVGRLMGWCVWWRRVSAARGDAAQSWPARRWGGMAESQLRRGGETKPKTNPNEANALRQNPRFRSASRHFGFERARAFFENEANDRVARRCARCRLADRLTPDRSVRGLSQYALADLFDRFLRGGVEVEQAIELHADAVDAICHLVTVGDLRQHKQRCSVLAREADDNLFAGLHLDRLEQADPTDRDIARQGGELLAAAPAGVARNLKPTLDFDSRDLPSFVAG